MIITQTVPICPNCQALLFRRIQNSDVYYVCADCMKIYKVIGLGKSEIELEVTDKEAENGG